MSSWSFLHVYVSACVDERDEREWTIEISHAVKYTAVCFTKTVFHFTLYIYLYFYLLTVYAVAIHVMTRSVLFFFFLALEPAASVYNFFIRKSISTISKPIQRAVYSKSLIVQLFPQHTNLYKVSAVKVSDLQSRIFIFTLL